MVRSHRAVAMGCPPLLIMTLLCHETQEVARANCTAIYLPFSQNYQRNFVLCDVFCLLGNLIKEKKKKTEYFGETAEE